MNIKISIYRLQSFEGSANNARAHLKTCIYKLPSSEASANNARAHLHKKENSLWVQWVAVVTTVDDGVVE